MIQLTHKQFQDVLKRFDTTEIDGVVMIQDDAGIFATKHNYIDTDIEDVVVIDGIEYTLTEEQKNIISKELDSYPISRNDAFNQDDYSHFTNLIYS